MDIFTLMDELSKHPKQEVELALTNMMMQGKIDFLSVNKAYINWLEEKKNDQLEQLSEANGLILQSFIWKTVKSKESDKASQKQNYRYTQESLYWLNKSQMFNMHDINQKFNYDEEFGKSVCFYERNKENGYM